MKSFSSPHGFTLVELLIYMGIGSILFVSLIPLSFSVEKELISIHQSLEKDRTADLIFKIYQISREADSSLLLICDQEGARIFYVDFPNDPSHQIGTIPSTECDLTDDILSFYIQGTEYQEDYSQT